jgi:hypothetical protein
MAEKLTREQLNGLTAEEKLAYQKRLNAARVAAYWAANKEKAAEYINYITYLHYILKHYILTLYTLNGDF